MYINTRTGPERLKEALSALGLKCGGTAKERAQRLWLTRSTPPHMLDKKLFAKVRATCIYFVLKVACVCNASGLYAPHHIIGHTHKHTHTHTHTHTLEMGLFVQGT